ncbi:uncharacterized protein [Nicotiana tomentosiformis]|uniref:uncharacterized protein n=1 Tax=Nicotiana tomentosiformis TaxID=4098 RepID=UPI00388C710B
MGKTSKTVPQKEKASSSRPSGDKVPVEPPHHDCPLDATSGVTKDAVLRPSSGEEGTKSPVPKLGKDKKRNAVSQSKDLKPKNRRVRRKAIALPMDSVQRLREEEEEDALALAISKFLADLSQCEVELQKVSGERDSLRLLCGQKDEVIRDLQANLAKAREEEAGLDKKEEVDQIKAECDRWKETINGLAVEKETILVKLSSADILLRSVKKQGLAQAKRIEELETRLAEAKVEIESSKVMADKSITVYRADAEATQMEARKAADTADTRAHWVFELAKCRSRRETLEEIHARGFNLAEEIKRAKELKADAKALASDGDDDDDDDDGSESGSDNGGSLVEKRPLSMITQKLSP